jgi:hypothetical protein
MSAEPLIRELFRTLETTLHERLALIEQILHAVDKPKVPLYDSEFISRIERLERLMPNQMVNTDSNNSLHEERISALEENLASLFADIEELKKQRTPPSPILPLRTHPVEMLLSGDEKVLDEEPVIEVVENVQEEELVEEEEEAEEEEEEEEGLELENLEDYNPKYTGKNLYKDQNNNVYLMDQDGGISEPLGTWNGKRFIPNSH